MSTEEMPSFACEETHTIEIKGRKLTFYAVSGPTLLRIQKRLGGPFSKVLHSLFAGDVAMQQAAIAELLEAAGTHPQAVGELVLDALHDERWNVRPAGPKDVDLFLSRCDGPHLAAMLGAVAAVNSKGFFPFVKGLLEDLRNGVQAAASSLVGEETSPAT